jgi:hypothetical protein
MDLFHMPAAIGCCKEVGARHGREAVEVRLTEVEATIGNRATSLQPFIQLGDSRAKSAMK